MSDATQSAVLPSTREELESLIDARIAEDRRRQVALRARQEELLQRHAEIDREARKKKCAETIRCNEDLLAIHAMAFPPRRFPSF